MEQLYPFMQQITQHINGKLTDDISNGFEIRIENPKSNDNILIRPITEGQIDGIRISVSREIDIESAKYKGDFTKCEKTLTQTTATMSDCGMVVNKPNKHLTAYCRQEKDIFVPYDELKPQSKLYKTNIATIKDDINEMRKSASENLKHLFEDIKENMEQYN